MSTDEHYTSAFKKIDDEYKTAIYTFAGLGKEIIENFFNDPEYDVNEHENNIRKVLYYIETGMFSNRQDPDEFKLVTNNLLDGVMAQINNIITNQLRDRNIVDKQVKIEGNDLKIILFIKTGEDDV